MCPVIITMSFDVFYPSHPPSKCVHVCSLRYSCVYTVLARGLAVSGLGNFFQNCGGVAFFLLVCSLPPFMMGSPTIVDRLAMRQCCASLLGVCIYTFTDNKYPASSPALSHALHNHHQPIFRWNNKLLLLPRRSKLQCICRVSNQHTNTISC